MTLTERGSSPYKAKLARQIDELRENQGKQRVIIQIILDADYLLGERNWARIVNPPGEDAVKRVLTSIIQQGTSSENWFIHLPRGRYSFT